MVDTWYLVRYIYIYIYVFILKTMSSSSTLVMDRRSSLHRLLVPRELTSTVMVLSLPEKHWTFTLHKKILPSDFRLFLFCQWCIIIIAELVQHRWKFNSRTIPDSTSSTSVETCPNKLFWVLMIQLRFLTYVHDVSTFHWEKAIYG